MGTLSYGDIKIDLDDSSLFHLDVLLTRLRGATFQLHVGLGAARDGNLLSLAITPGVALALEYANTPDLTVDMDAINYAVFQVQSGGFVSVPFVTKADSSS
jgi:hypothetical protein